MTTTLRTFEVKDGWPALRERLTGRLPADHLLLLDDAVDFARLRHADQVRPAGEPYLEHLLEVVSVLAEAIGTTDVDVLRAGVLHDVVEDTDCSLDEVRDRFGDRVAVLVDWVTKPPAAPGQSSASVRTAYLARLRDAPADVLLVKLADRLSNVQRLDSHPRPVKRRAYYQETVATIVPLAQSHPWFRTWYTTWRAAFGHLAAEPSQALPG